MSDSFAERLIAAGMSAVEANRKAALFESAEAALTSFESSPRSQASAWFVPGRVEFLGKHTDYAGGRSLVCATEQGFCLIARPRLDHTVRVVDAASGSRVDLELRPDLGVPEADWTAYPTTIVRRLVRDFPGVSTGIDLAFASDLPPAAGVSSSSALVVGFFLALAHANRLPERPDYRAAFPELPDLAGYLGAAENGKAFGSFGTDRGVGTQGGSQDQTAVLCSVPGALLQASFDPVRLERVVPLPSDHCLVIGVSGVLAEKTGAARESYNAAAGAVQAILGRWRAATGAGDPTLAAALRSRPDARPTLARLVADDPILRTRLDQFMAESEEIIPAAAEALLHGDLETLGVLVDRSQAGAERGLGNQIAETIHLQRSARRLGAAAASAFGAGFGGSVWALIHLDRETAFRAAWAEDYGVAFPARGAAARFFPTRAGPGAVKLGG
jgi:galactokinase